MGGLNKIHRTAAMRALIPKYCPRPVAAPRPASTVGQAQFLSVFSAVLLPMFLASVDQTLLATALPAIGRDFGGLADTSWIALGYLMASALMIPMYGRLGDRFGHRRLLAAALAVFVLGSTLGGCAPAMGWLIAARVLQGLGGGGLMVLSQALIGQLLPPQERPRYQGYFAAVYTLSSLAGPVLGGLVVHLAGWRWLFWGLLPLGLLAAWRVLRLPQLVPVNAPRVGGDPLGMALFAGAGVLSMLWLTFAGQRFGWASPTSAALVGAAALLWTLLVRRERVHPAPFLPVEVLRLRGALPAVGTVVVFAGALFALVFFLPIYVQLGRGGSASDAGLLLLPLTLGVAAGAVVTGRVATGSGRVGVLPRLGLGLSALSLATLALAPPSQVLLTLLCVLCGLGFGTVMPNVQVILQTLAGRSRLGAASAVVSMSRALGSTLGTALFGAAIFGQLGSESAVDAPPLHSAPTAAQIVSAYHWAFGGLALLLLLGAAVAGRMPVIGLGAATPAASSSDE
jgi:MFS family permease